MILYGENHKFNNKKEIFLEKLKVGIIGAGRIGHVHAKSITYHIPQAEIVAISDIYFEGSCLYY